MAITQTITALVGEHYDRVLLDNLYPSLYFYQFGDKKRVPAGTGKVAHWTRYVKFAAAGALTESSAVGVSDLSATRVSATLAGYGIATRHSDFIIMTGISDVVTDSINEVAKSLALKIDSVTRTAICTAGTLQFGSSQTTKVINTTPITETDLLDAVVTLDSADAKRYPDGNYVCLAHPRTLKSIKAQTGTGSWVDVNKYANSQTVGQIYRGEVGMLHGIRFIQTSNIPKLIGTAANSANTGLSGTSSGYNAFIFGPGAYGVVELEGGSAKTYIKQLGSAGTADPINQRATVGAKVYFAAVSLTATNPRLIRIAHGASV